MSQVDLVHGQRYTVHTAQGIREDTFRGYEWQALRNPDGTLFSMGYLAAVWEGLGPLRITGGPEWKTARVAAIGGRR